MSDAITTAALYDCCVPYLQALFAECEYPWELLPRIRSHMESLFAAGITGFTLLRPHVLVGEGVTVADNVTFEGPAILGTGTVIRPGAYIRGWIITGKECVLGNSCEYKNCILLDNVQTPHYNYIGDSVLGNGAHTGAGTICSNLKADGKPVTIRGEQCYETGLRKVGGFLADGADVGSGCVLNPGTVIGKATSVYPLTSLRGIYSAHSIVKNTTTVVARKEEPI